MSRFRDDPHTFLIAGGRRWRMVHVRKLNRVVDLVAKGLDLRAACRVAGIDDRTVYRACRSLPGFGERLQDARNQAAAREHALADLVLGDIR